MLMASLFWGSNFAVTKGYDMKDGMVFQFWMCTGVLVVGLITLLWSAKDPIATHDFRPVLAYDGVLGGVIWCIGNLLTVSIVNSIGLGLGLSIWGGVSLVVSFIIGLVNVLGLKPQPINEYYGIPGVVLAVGSLVMFTFVTPTVKSAADSQKSKDSDGSGSELSYHVLDDDEVEEPKQEKVASGGLTKLKGIAMVCVCVCVCVHVCALPSKDLLRCCSRITTWNCCCESCCT